MRIHFLEASVPLTKSYVLESDKSITKTPYPLTWEFTSHDEDVGTIDELAVQLRAHAAKGHCLLKGRIERPLVKESRAGSTKAQDPTEFVVLDLDGLPTDYEGSKITVDRLLEAMSLNDVSYIVQWSASYGISDTHLRAHVFMLLDKPHAAPLLKQWLIQLNHATPMLRAAMSLTKTGNAISWPLDVSACQNDKLIYITPPRLTGIKDPVPKGKRIELVKRKRATLAITGQINGTDKNKQLTHKRLDELRDAAGLPKRKYTYRIHGSTEIMVKPDSAVITDMKQERGFVYFNLNGGDSWAYYHPENNPDFIYNFKGEPTYLTKELLPEYWAQLSETPRVSTAGELYLAFCDRRSGAYWRGTYNLSTDLLDITQAKNETQVRHFAKQFGVPLPEYIPEWELEFDPHDNVRVDPGNRTVNLFQPTSFMLSTPKPQRAVPKTIMRVISNALGDDPGIVEHFINWLAYILQQRDRTCTAWVLHGVPGTGKGVLINKILRPIFGSAQTAIRRMEELNEPYNHWMESALIVFVDEVQTRALQNERGVMAKLKNFITEPIITIRRMHTGGYEARNYANFIFASNMPDPVSIDKHDRRMNVGAYQRRPLKDVLSRQEIDGIERELQAFHDYLALYPVDETKATTVIESEDRDTMISISESSADSVASALLDGNFEFFVDQLPTSSDYKTNILQLNRVEDYRMVLQTLMAHTDRNSGECSISRDSLRTMFDYCVGKMPESPHKFTSLLKHHRIHIGKVWCIDRTVNGIKVKWQDVAAWKALEKIVNPAADTKPAVKKLKAVK